MGESNGQWGAFIHEGNDVIAQAWDACAFLPDPGTNPILDTFCERKHLDIAALRRLGARLSTPTVLAFPHNGTALKYRDMVTGRRWAAPGSTYPDIRLVPAVLASGRDVRVLVCEGETDAARLTMLYPEADIAVLGAGARSFSAPMASTLAGYGRAVYAATDADEAGEAGAVAIIHLTKGERLFPPAGREDWCEVTPEDDVPVPWDCEETVTPSVAGVDWQDMQSLREEGLDLPEMLIPDLLYNEGLHWIDGHPGTGKTNFTLGVIVADLLKQGRHVVWFDYEMGVRLLVRNALDAGISWDQLINQFHYAWQPPMQVNERLAAVVETWPDALIVFDSAGKALYSAGLDENSNKEVAQFTSPLVKAARDLHVPILCIDHIAKEKEASGYAVGAGVKSRDMDLHWRLVPHTASSRTEIGLVRLSRKKDRMGGTTTNTRWFTMGDGAGHLTFADSDGPLEPAETKARQPMI